MGSCDTVGVVVIVIVVEWWWVAAVVECWCGDRGSGESGGMGLGVVVVPTVVAVIVKSSGGGGEGRDGTLVLLTNLIGTMSTVI